MGTICTEAGVPQKHKIEGYHTDRVSESKSSRVLRSTQFKILRQASWVTTAK